MRVGQHVQRSVGYAQRGCAFAPESSRISTVRAQHCESEEAVDHAVKKRLDGSDDIRIVDEKLTQSGDQSS